MIKTETTYRKFCDKCQEETDRLYGPEGIPLQIDLPKTMAQGEKEYAAINPFYVLNQKDRGRKVLEGSLCEECFKNILTRALNKLEKRGGTL